MDSRNTDTRQNKSLRNNQKESCSDVIAYEPKEIVEYHEDSRLNSLESDSAAHTSYATALDIGHNSSILIESKLQRDIYHQNDNGNKISNDITGYEREEDLKRQNRLIAQNTLSTALSAFYAKFIIVLGVAIPITNTLSSETPQIFYQGFYFYLYLTSIIFVSYMIFIHLKSRLIFTAIFDPTDKNVINSRESVADQNKPSERYGSFYLRIGAVAFGIGTMVYSGLECGQYFELKEDDQCRNIFVVLNPIFRMILTLLQMQFIFLNTNDVDLLQTKFFARFGLMHMIATNVCEWLYVLVEETKHEIDHLKYRSMETFDTESLNNITTTEITHMLSKRSEMSEALMDCRRSNIMGGLINDAAPFLFPCTIEFSLICAVTLYEMWKRMAKLRNKIPNINRSVSLYDEAAREFTIDCTMAQRGLFAGILVIVVTTISLIIYFQTLDKPRYESFGILEVMIAESALFVITLLAVFVAMYRMRRLKYSKSVEGTLPLDCTLLIVAQSGVYIYSMFSILASYFSSDGAISLANEILSMLQTSVQTLFVLNAWWQRCRTNSEIRQKPGREIVTFLLIANIALWTISSFIKGHASFRPTHLEFFGHWAWTIITHVSMPLTIYYRFHSTICLFEIWKTTYKRKKH